MLVSLGKRPDEQDVVDLLIECHGRIRKFLTMARALTGARGAMPEEITHVAQQVRRYFAESLPLHIADEHDDIMPRLADAGAEVATALAEMDTEHTAHEPLVGRLVELCEAIAADPARLDGLRGELGDLVHRLGNEFLVHLEREESVIFPALRQLPAEQREAIHAAMRERRARVLR